MNKCNLHCFRSVGDFFVFFEHEIVKRRRNVALAYNSKPAEFRRLAGFVGRRQLSKLLKFNTYAIHIQNDKANRPT